MSKRRMFLGIILLGMSLVSGVYAFKQYMNYAQSDKINDEVLSNIAVAKTVVQDTEYDINDFLDLEDQIEQPEEYVEVTYPAMDIDFVSLREINPDFVGVLYIPVLDLYQPIAHSKDNNEYLGTMYDGTKNGAGTIFMSKESKDNWSSRNTIIFGHNMKNESMFGKLRRFRKEENLCSSDPYIYVYTESGVRKFHIFAYYLANYPEDVCYADIASNSLYDQYIEKALSRNDYPGDDYVDNFENRPNVLTLSTCYGTGHKYLTVVNASFVGYGNTPVIENEVADNE